MAKLHFRKVTDTAPVVQFLVDRLQSHLKHGESVLWLVPGGSAIPVVVAVANVLAEAPHQRLTVMLTDERYGPVGHPDSNWQQLLAAGFSLEGARLVPVLEDHLPLETVTQRFADNLGRALDEATYRLGFFGMGPDGHTSGILPGSPAVYDSNLTCAYYGEKYERVTTTPTALARLDEAVVYAAGEAKQAALDQLEDEVPLETQPAQVLKTIATVTVFNDYKGEEL